ncbi:hypothetical protein AVEN_154593-1 [Araneus ventricosus]|uniref:Uncharacterized protein n=1 Tax=Araneus ventricosus TaxID=182803 RepID=A0A4Y2FUF3_ARAVE|nr:hypothetical protein AVEN_154593-1 [Araneus ventricosus]
MLQPRSKRHQRTIFRFDILRRKKGSLTFNLVSPSTARDPTTVWTNELSRMMRDSSDLRMFTPFLNAGRLQSYPLLIELLRPYGKEIGSHRHGTTPTDVSNDNLSLYTGAPTFAICSESRDPNRVIDTPLGNGKQGEFWHHRDSLNFSSKCPIPLPVSVCCGTTRL